MEDNKTIEQLEETVQKDELKAAIEKTMDDIRTQSMLLGAQAICQIIQNKIYTFESSGYKKSTNDYKRLVKDIQTFCNTGLSRNVYGDKKEESVNSHDTETAQN